MVAFNIDPIENFNDVTHHLVEVVYAHLTCVKGAPVVGLPHSISRLVNVFSYIQMLIKMYAT